MSTRAQTLLDELKVVEIAGYCERGIYVPHDVWVRLKRAIAGFDAQADERLTAAPQSRPNEATVNDTLESKRPEPRGTTD